MAIATAVPVQAFYTHGDSRIYGMEMRFMFGCIRNGGSMKSCKADLVRERANW